MLPDPQFNSRLASMIVARLMKHGKKSTAQRILSDAFSLINDRTGTDPLELFEKLYAMPPLWLRFVPAGLAVPPTRCRWKFARSVVQPWLCAGW